jgi:hypothetical protein
MSLSKIVAEAIDANEVEGVINRHSAINLAVPQVLADGEMTEMCVRSHLSKVIATSCKKRARELAEKDSGQSSMFGLRDAHVLDHGEGVIKRTEALTREEFLGIIRVRQDQVVAAMAYLKRLRDAERETRAVWDRYPTWTWGQVETAYARKTAKAA